MSEKKNLKMADLLNTQSGAEKNRNKEELNTPLIVRNRIDGTPFHIVGNEEVGYFLTMGRYRLTDHYDTITEAETALERDFWDIILHMIITVIDIDKKDSVKIEVSEKTESDDYDPLLDE